MARAEMQRVYRLLKEARERGEITAEEEKQAQQQILQARMTPKSP